jgi:hypothetical protein
MWLSLTFPESMEQFAQNEISIDPADGLPYFIDGWGQPILFLRWAPGFTPYSDIQSANTHDPFDSRNTETGSDYIQLIPLIYSSGPDQKAGIIWSDKDGKDALIFYGIDPSSDHLDKPLNPSAHPANDSSQPVMGTPDPSSPSDYLDNITNHRIEQN